ncbi:MAG: hypothetical protein LBP31_02820 [Holosporales bacterium]|jgi:hypothetical protein|nr:hypothetical protein [Holosporales bacterium]
MQNKLKQVVAAVLVLLCQEASGSGSEKWDIDRLLKGEVAEHCREFRKEYIGCAQAIPFSTIIDKKETIRLAIIDLFFLTRPGREKCPNRPVLVIEEYKVYSDWLPTEYF